MADAHSAAVLAPDPVHHGEGQDGSDLAVLHDPDAASRGAGREEVVSCVGVVRG
jgi:hypothetical protein